MKRTLPGCLCFDSFVCSLHRDGANPYTVEESESFADAILSEKSPIISDEMPWNPDELPERLRGFGHRMADQDGGSGSEWVTPQQDFEGQMIEAVKVLLDGREI